MSARARGIKILYNIDMTSRALVDYCIMPIFKLKFNYNKDVYFTHFIESRNAESY